MFTDTNTTTWRPPTEYYFGDPPIQIGKTTVVPSWTQPIDYHWNTVSWPLDQSSRIAALERKVAELEKVLAAKGMNAYIVDRFAAIPEVLDIYLDQGRADDTEFTKVIVYTSNDVYDDDLMDKLLHVELDVMHAYPDELFDFRYIPKGLADRDDVYTSDARVYRSADAGRDE